MDFCAAKRPGLAFPGPGAGVTDRGSNSTQACHTNDFGKGPGQVFPQAGPAGALGIKWCWGQARLCPTRGNDAHAADRCRELAWLGRLDLIIDPFGLLGDAEVD